MCPILKWRVLVPASSYILTLDHLTPSRSELSGLFKLTCARSIVSLNGERLVFTTKIGRHHVSGSVEARSRAKMHLLEIGQIYCRCGSICGIEIEAVQPLTG